MLTIRIPIVVIVLLHCPFRTIAATLRYSNHLVEWWADILHDGDRMACRKADAAAPDASDCLHAIEIFPNIPYPTGPFIASHGRPPPDPTRPISIALDKRNYALPAAFRSGTCVVRVWKPDKIVPPTPIFCTSCSGP